MTDNQEIEVEVVEIESRPRAGETSRLPVRPQRDASARGADSGRAPYRNLQPIVTIPKWLLPVLVVIGIAVALIALALFLVIGIPVLLVRALLRLLR